MIKEEIISDTNNHINKVSERVKTDESICFITINKEKANIIADTMKKNTAILTNSIKTVAKRTHNITNYNVVGIIHK